MNEPTLTPAECHLVKHLIDLYNASWKAGKCTSHCLCTKCDALEEASNHNASTLDSLTEKVESVLK